MDLNPFSALTFVTINTMLNFDGDKNADDKCEQASRKKSIFDGIKNAQSFKFVHFHTVQRGNLTKHYLTHTGERPHKCNECGRGFYTREHVKRHKLVHTGEKPFLCIICGMKFGQLGRVYS